MANTLYHAVNISDSPAVTTDKLNDSICSHVIVKSGFVYYKTLFKVSLAIQYYYIRELYHSSQPYIRSYIDITYMQMMTNDYLRVNS